MNNQENIAVQLAEPVEEEVFIPIFMDLCDLTTYIINKFLNKQIELKCKINEIPTLAYRIVKQKIIALIAFLTFDKYDSSGNKLWFKYPRIFYVKLSDLVNKYNSAKNVDAIMNDELKTHISNLINFMNKNYYSLINSSETTFKETVVSYSPYYNNDSITEEYEVKKNEMIARVLNGSEMKSLIFNITNSKFGGKPSQKKIKTIKRTRTKRKRRQKKNTKKSFRK
jgi:hypothetical protein